jgi:hypothetical protein
MSKESKDETSEHLKEQQQQSRERMEQEFEISGFYITRNQLEAIGYDTADVDDETMDELTNALRDMLQNDLESHLDTAAVNVGIPVH